MKKLLAALLISVSAVPVSAGVVTFDDTGVNVGNTSTPAVDSGSSGGLNFSIANHGHLTGAQVGYARNGTVSLLLDTGDVTFTKVGGGAFSINSFDAGEWDLSVVSFSLYGYNGADLVASVSQTTDGFANFGNGPGADFQTFALTGFTNLTSFTISRASGYGLIDNIVFDQAADVPEPAMLGLFGLGATGLGLSRRRKNALA